MIITRKYLTNDLRLKLAEAAEICFECGVCCEVKAHSCHVTYDREKFNPRYTFVYDCLGTKEPDKNPNIWLCVSCHKYEEVCPYDVSPISFIEEMKALFFQSGMAPPLILGEVTQVLSTGYAFPITPATDRLRESLGLKKIQPRAQNDLEKIAEGTKIAAKLGRGR